MEETDLRTLIDIVQKIVLRRSDVSVEWLADHLGKRASTLYNEINPNHTGTAKLGAQDLIRIMDLLKDVSPLEYMAARLGCIVTPVPSMLRDADPAEPAPGNFRSLLAETRKRMDALQRLLEGSDQNANLDGGQCLDLLLACQACLQSMGEVFRAAQAGAARSEDRN